MDNIFRNKLSNINLIVCKIIVILRLFHIKVGTYLTIYLIK